MHKNISSRVAYIISHIFNAPLFSVYLLPAIISSEHLTSIDVLLTTAICIFTLLVMPTILIIYYKIKGKTDIFVSKHSDRPKFFIPALIGYAIGFIVFYTLKMNILALYHLCYFTVTFSLFIVTLYWKISIHTAGIAGPVTMLALKFGYRYLILQLLLLPVGWARLKLHAHTLAQIAAGAIQSIAVTYLTVIFFNSYL